MLKRLGEFLRKAVRRGLESILTPENEEQAGDSLILDCIVQGQSGPLAAKYLIRGVIGPRLVGVPVSGGGHGERLISEAEAIDPKKFHKLWNKFSGGAKLIWEDTGEEVGSE